MLTTFAPDFNHPKGSLLGIMNAILPLGAVFGTLPAAWVSDHYGRRMAMLVGDIIMILSSIIQTASINSQSLAKHLSLPSPPAAIALLTSLFSQLPCTWRLGSSSDLA